MGTNLIFFVNFKMSAISHNEVILKHGKVLILTPTIMEIRGFVHLAKNNLGV